jgi:hypothetical protein
VKLPQQNADYTLKLQPKKGFFGFGSSDATPKKEYKSYEARINEKPQGSTAFALERDKLKESLKEYQKSYVAVESDGSLSEKPDLNEGLFETMMTGGV